MLASADNTNKLRIYSGFFRMEMKMNLICDGENHSSFVDGLWKGKKRKSSILMFFFSGENIKK